MRFSRISVLAVLAAVMFFASNASAAFVVGGSDGWSLSTDGMVNLFALYQTGDNIPDGVNAAYIPTPDGGDTPGAKEGFRVTNGFLPNILAFNIKAPTMKGLDTAARIGFYPSSSYGNLKNRTDTEIDLREVFFTVDGNFGQVMVGKGLSLFLGQNLLTEQTLMGVGRMAGALNTSALGVTLGRIGYGYLYPNFDAQFRYTTPDMGGAKLAIALYDPSRINSNFSDPLNPDAPAVNATETKLPRVEAELSYAGVAGGATIKGYVNGMWQQADFTNTVVDYYGLDKDDVTAWGVGGGFVAGLAGFELSGSGFTGKGLGTNLMLDADALDSEGKPRKSWGYIGQLTYTLPNEGKTRLGFSYGANRFGETNADAAARAADSAFIKAQSMGTLQMSHDITTNLKLVAEASYINHEWQNGAHMEVQMYSLGTFFIW